MLKDLVKLANHLDSKGFSREADLLDKIITKLSETNPYRALPGATWVGGVNPYSALQSEIGERPHSSLNKAVRTPLRETGARMAARKLLGKVLVPLGFAMDIVEIYEAAQEGVNAFREISEAEQKISINIVKSAIGDALTSTLGELERDGWHKEGEQGLNEMKKAQLQWRQSGLIDARMKEAFRVLVSIATQIKAWDKHPIDNYIRTASTGSYAQYLDESAIRELYRHLIGRLTLTEKQNA